VISLVIYGSRTATPSILDITAAVQSLGIASHLDIGEVLCGGAKGADDCGRRWANQLMVPVIHMPADWDRYGKRAGYVRNRQMAERATHGVGWWHRESGGTSHMTTCLVALGKRVAVVEIR
jgi:hypothetical protein